MNVHHLELFYYVAKHGGITEAVRKIPYGIQQPAVSGQIIQLEEFLGVTLFHRRPFSLTPAGVELFEFIKPFFGNLESIAHKLQGGMARSIRIGASESVLRDHLPDLVLNVRKKFPELKITMREANQPQLEPWLDSGEVDLAITLLESTSLPGLQRKPLLSMPLILLVNKGSNIKSADELWSRDRIDEPLIALPSNEIVCKEFQKELARMEIDWFPSIEVSSLDLIQTYVGKGYGIGLTVRLPMMKLPSDIRVLELPKFPKVTVGALWRGKPGPLIQAFLQEFEKRANAVSQQIGSAGSAC